MAKPSPDMPHAAAYALPVPISLREHMAALAKATDMRVGITSQAVQGLPALKKFREALAADPELRARARTMLLSIDERVALRDHISRWQKAVLEGALSSDE